MNNLFFNCFILVQITNNLFLSTLYLYNLPITCLLLDIVKFIMIMASQYNNTYMSLYVTGQWSVIAVKACDYLGMFDCFMLATSCQDVCHCVRMISDTQPFSFTVSEL